MQTNHARRLALIEVAVNGFSNVSFQFAHGVRLSENGMTKGLSFITALSRFLDRKDDFAVWHLEIILGN